MALHYHIIQFDSLPSTNRYLKEHYHHLPDKTVVVANHQTAGRGRFDRQWVDDHQHSLLVSMLLKEEPFSYSLPLVSLVTALALAKTLDPMVVTQIKWPNDILINGKKVAGILLEGIASSQMEALVIGIGLNINTPTFFGELANKATSLAIETGKTYDKELLLTAFLASFEKEYRRLTEGAFDLEEYQHRLATLNQTIFYLGSPALVVGVNLEGALVVKKGDKVYELTSGEIETLDLYKPQNKAN